MSRFGACFGRCIGCLAIDASICTDASVCRKVAQLADPDHDVDVKLMAGEVDSACGAGQPPARRDAVSPRISYMVYYSVHILFHCNELLKLPAEYSSLF